MGRKLQHAVWLARIATVALGLVVVGALLNLQQQRSLLGGSAGLADEPPPGAALRGAEFLGAGPELPDGRRAALEDGEGLVDGAEDADQDDEQRVAFSLARIAGLLGWGAAQADDAEGLEEADPDRIRLSDLKPLSNLQGQGLGQGLGQGAKVPAKASDWQDSALLRAFVARFGTLHTTTAKSDGLDDGELKDLVTATSRPDARTPSTVAEQARSTPPEVAPTPLPPLPACPLNGVITTEASEGAAAGTRVFEYAAAWLVSRGVGTGWRTPLVPVAVLRDLAALFERPSLSAVEQLPPACRLDPQHNETLGEDDLQDVQALPARFMDPGVPLVVRSGVLLPQLLAAHLSALRQELVLKKEMLLAAQAVLDVCRQRLQRGGQGGDDVPVRFIAVHARRNDSAPWLRRRRRRPGVDYFRSAMAHFRSKQADVVFVVTSDDPQWVRDNLAAGPEVCLTGSEAAVDPVDLAVLASCDGAVLDLSDTALATAVLAAKQVVAPRGLRAAAPGLAALPGWTFL